MSNELIITTFQLKPDTHLKLKQLATNNRNFIKYILEALTEEVLKDKKLQTKMLIVAKNIKTECDNHKLAEKNIKEEN